MFAAGEVHSGNPVETRGGLRLAGLALAAAALVALPLATADAASMYVHSADRGELAGGRLTLYQVGGNVTWTATSGRTGVARVRRALKRLFSPKTPATGTLHIAGQRGGEEFTFRLRKPRYNAARGTVSYRAKPLAKRATAAAAARSFAAAGTARSFGPASLSVVPHSELASGGNGGNDCLAGYSNETWYAMEYISSAKWDSDTWGSDGRLEDGTIIGNTHIVGGSQFDGAWWESDGGLWQGCANHTTWKFVTDPGDPRISGTPPDNVTIDTNLEWDWTKNPVFSCSTSDPRFTCDLDRDTERWHVRDTQRP